ncbi:MAG: leucyl/phenylalanyl-tRNA--protein transferase [Flaviramulus sp.]|nr:leucyl/phenylalanyl-tRNA--protein transferase [Flaviramulus sp.]
MQFLSEKIWFPNVNEATDEGLLAYGGDLSIERLLLAYQTGIFPWFDSEELILWWSPSPRFVLFPDKLKISKSMQQVLRNKDYVVTFNKDFKGVITECSKIERAEQAGTWITKNMIEAYVKLHELGYAKSIEVWKENRLVGGLYGVDTGNGVFCGESMFTKESNASKVGFITLIQNSNYKLIDCQVYTSHLNSLGAEEISRELFMKFLKVN